MIKSAYFKLALIWLIVGVIITTSIKYDDGWGFVSIEHEKKELKELKEPKKLKELKELREPKELKELKELREPKELKPLKETNGVDKNIYLNSSIALTIGGALVIIAFGLKRMNLKKKKDKKYPIEEEELYSEDVPETIYERHSKSKSKIEMNENNPINKDNNMTNSEEKKLKERIIKEMMINPKYRKMMEEKMKKARDSKK